MLESFLLSAVVIATVIMMFLPWNGYLRLGPWMLIGIALIVILNAGRAEDGLGAMLLGLLVFLIFMMWVVAGFVQYGLRRGITGNWPEYAPLRSDIVLVWAGWALLALCFFLFMAFQMAGSSGAVALHVSLLAIAGVCYRLPGFAITLALLTGYSFYHPRIVAASAQDAMAGAEHCIFFPQHNRFAAGWHDLTFLTMDKADWTRHAFVIAKNDPENLAYWSYRHRRFETEEGQWFALSPPTCPKNPDLDDQAPQQRPTH